MQNGHSLTARLNTEELNGKKISELMDPLKDQMHAASFKLNDQLKIQLISNHFKQIMLILGLDLDEDGLKNSPMRVASMFVNELFSGLNPSNKPEMTLFENGYRYKNMVVEKNISLFSICEHHFLPIIGKVHVGYFPNGKLIGLSKINRLVNYFSKRPQVQEKLTGQIADGLKEALCTNDIAVIIDAIHLCVAARGIKDSNSSTVSSAFSGRFLNEDSKMEFLTLIKQ